MKKETVAQDNIMFFVTTVGMSLALGCFAREVMASSLEMSQFPTGSVGDPGYIKIDSSLVREEGEWYWIQFADKVINGLLPLVSYGFSSRTKFEGGLAEKVTLGRDGYEFSFQIKEYERDSDHHFEIIKPQRLVDVPEDERLGRVVYLTIKLD